MKLKNLLTALFIGFALILVAQDDTKPQRFDFGKMWTFENPPKEWFKEAYQFAPPDSWYDDVRKSSLRFATWCSASFVSPDGLIMTNHHCSRDVVPSLQKEGESLLKNGFYAATLADERKAEGLFVEQLIVAEDITDQVMRKNSGAKDDIEKKVLTDSALAQLTREYAARDGWKGLRIQTVTYYSGGKFSLYGYKKYSDIRLVMVPENELGYFGGDPDNFTFPRYCLDFTFWRAYDEQGKPLNTRDHYFKFNTSGAEENEPVFVIGNPGSTERYRTISQFEYDRDIRFPAQIKMMTNRRDIMAREYEKAPNDDLLNDIFGLGNSIKAMTGILEGLRNPSLLGRKRAMEQEIRSKTKLKGEDPWIEMEKEYSILRKYGSALTLLGPSQIKGKALNMMFAAANYEKLLMENNSKNEATLEKLKAQMKEFSKDLNTPKEMEYLKTLYEEVLMFEHPDNKLSEVLLDGKTSEKAAHKLLDKTDFSDAEKLDKILMKPAEKLAKCDDPILEAGRFIVSKYQEAAKAFQNSTTKRKSLEAKIANNVFKVKGNNLPPDATFTLRLADGLVRAYEYNGTTAPYKTSFYGLYDRFYSYNKKSPWSLPEKWLNPPSELLSSPFCFVTTNDIIGGNSGSPMINRNKEVVGLVFDGNIESLPGNFIYDEKANRTVGVHAGGIYAALKYIYKADRLTDELRK